MAIRLPCGNDDAKRRSCVDRGDQWISFEPLIVSIRQQLATYCGGRGHTMAEKAMVWLFVVAVVVVVVCSRARVYFGILHLTVKF